MLYNFIVKFVYAEWCSHFLVLLSKPFYCLQGISWSIPIVLLIIFAVWKLKSCIGSKLLQLTGIATAAFFSSAASFLTIFHTIFCTVFDKLTQNDCGCRPNRWASYENLLNFNVRQENFLFPLQLNFILILVFA